jgi:four helix bundle protein
MMNDEQKDSSFITHHWEVKMAEDKRDLRVRTKDFALRIIRLYTALPKTTEAQVISKQLLRSGTSVGAHYREASRARSTAEFVSKMEVGLQELDETDYWLELLEEGGIVSAERLANLRSEINELIAIFVASVKTAKQSKG